MEDKTPGEILEEFYKDNHLPSDGGQSLNAVKIEVTRKISFYIPNFDARRKAVIKHDIHHILTGYSASSLAGEGEISAWEIASGCTRYPAAFFINTSGVLLGMMVKPAGTLRAWARGRRTKNLYHDILTNEDALKTKISELKKILLLDRHEQKHKVYFADFILFAGFTIFAMVVSVLSLVFLPVVITYSLWYGLKKKV